MSGRAVRSRRAVVIGVGNPDRRDDGVGPAVVEELRNRAPADADLLSGVDDVTALLGALAATRLAVVVDAARCPAPRPGHVRRVSLTGPEDGLGTDAGSGTHGLGVLTGVRLARALGRAPDALVVLAVEVADVGQGRGLSPEVAAAVPAVADLVRAELTAGHRPVGETRAPAGGAAGPSPGVL